MWGQEGDRKMAVLVMRIIPTRVGTSSAVYRKVNSHWDHPHACGDKSQQQEASCSERGSSPRVWGQVLSLYGRFSCSGIIPTRVGTSRIAEALKQKIEGSSPRVWGQGGQSLNVHQKRRIIPTRVGTSNLSQ